MRTAALATILTIPAAALAQDYAWINHQGDAALQFTPFAASAVRMGDVLHVAADDFKVRHDTRMTKIVFYSVWYDQPEILGGDWYIYYLDLLEGEPTFLVASASDVPIETVDSGLVNQIHGTIYRNTMHLDVVLQSSFYILAFRTHCAPGPGRPENAPLHHVVPRDGDALWNFAVTPDGDVLEPWIYMTDFEPKPKTWAFELYGEELPRCRADMDSDGSLTVFDFLAFQSFFDQRHPDADFDYDGDFTLFDFLAFQSAFDVGCP